MQIAIKAEPPVNSVLRPNLSDKTHMKNVQAMTFTAPNNPVSKRSRVPLLPTSSLKYCGAKTARALLPVAFWKTNSMGPIKKRNRLAGSRSSLIEKASLTASSARRPSCVSVNSSCVLSPSSPRIQDRDFHASSLRPLDNSHRVDSGRVKQPRSMIPAATNSRPSGICHSDEVFTMLVFLATP